MTVLAKSRASDLLNRSLRFCARHICLSEAQSILWVQQSREPLRMLLDWQRNILDGLITLEESWFYFSMDYKAVWLPSGQSCRKERKRHSSPRNAVHRCLESRLVSPIDASPKAGKFNTHCSANNMFAQIVNARCPMVFSSIRKLIMKVHPTCSRQNPESGTSALCSQNLTLYDLYLFGPLQERLQGYIASESSRPEKAGVPHLP
jgi:hypothetical protein